MQGKGEEEGQEGEEGEEEKNHSRDRRKEGRMTRSEEEREK